MLCEGYDYPEDPYILAGSCGLEYTLELTQQGRDKQKTGGSSSYQSNYAQDSYAGFIYYFKHYGFFRLLKVLLALFQETLHAKMTMPDLLINNQCPN